MKRFRGLARYGILGIFNTAMGYALFVALSLVVSQLVASVITELVAQSIKYYGLSLFVFRGNQRKRPSLTTYVLYAMPGSLVVFVNVAVLSKFTPPYITGLLGIMVSILYYKIFESLYKPSRLG